MELLHTELLKKIAANIKMIALDLDDTTLSSNGILSDNTKEALMESIAHGIEVVIASGRSFSSLPKEITEITEIRYGITSNGAAIYDLKKGKRIKSLKIDPKSTIRILKALKNEKLCMEAFVDGTPYSDARFVSNPEQHGCTKASSINYIKATRIPKSDIQSFMLENIDYLDSIDVRCSTLKERNRIENILRSQVEDIYITSSLDNLLEITNPLAGKGSGLKYLCGLLNVSAEEAAACGNADNDIDMMKYAALGVAVKNGTKKCLEAANIITDDNDHDGVAQIIWEILKIQQNSKK